MSEKEALRLFDIAKSAINALAEQIIALQAAVEAAVVEAAQSSLLLVKAADGA